MPNFLVEVGATPATSNAVVSDLSSYLPLLKIPVQEAGKAKGKILTKLKWNKLDALNRLVIEINNQPFLGERTVLLEKLNRKISSVKNKKIKTVVDKWALQVQLPTRLKCLENFLHIQQIELLAGYLPPDIEHLFNALLKTVKAIRETGTDGWKLAQVNMIEKILNLFDEALRKEIGKEENLLNREKQVIINEHIQALKKKSVYKFFYDTARIQQYRKELEEKKKKLPKLVQFFDNMPLDIVSTLRLGHAEFEKGALPKHIEITALRSNMNPVFLIKWKNSEEETLELAIIRVYPLNQPDDYNKYVRRNETMLQFASEAERARVLNTVFSEFVIDGVAMELAEWLPISLMDKIKQHSQAKHYDSEAGVMAMVEDMLPYIERAIKLLIHSKENKLVTPDFKPENVRIKGKAVVFSDQKAIFPEILFDKTSIELTPEYMEPKILMARDKKRKERSEILRENMKLPAQKQTLLPPEDEDKGFQWQDYKEAKVEEFLLGNTIYQCVTSELAISTSFPVLTWPELYRFETHSIFQPDPADPTKIVPVIIQQHKVFEGEPGSIRSNLKKLVAALTDANPESRISLEEALRKVKRLQHQLNKHKKAEKDYTVCKEEIKMQTISGLERAFGSRRSTVGALPRTELKKRSSTSEILTSQQKPLTAPSSTVMTFAYSDKRVKRMSLQAPLPGLSLKKVYSFKK